MRLLRRVRAYIRKYRSDKFLKKYDCKTYHEYNHRFDPGRNIRANMLSDYYPGYEYVYVFPKNHAMYTDVVEYIFTEYKLLREINLWCDNNVKHKWRVDWLPLYPVNNEMIINALAEYYYVIAFKDQLDFNWFVLRWS